MSSDYSHMDGENCVLRAIERLPAEERYRARQYLEKLRERAEPTDDDCGAVRWVPHLDAQIREGEGE